MSLDRERAQQLEQLRRLGGDLSIYLGDDELHALACITLHDLGETLTGACQHCKVSEYGFSYYDTPISEVRCGVTTPFGEVYADLCNRVADFATYFKSLAMLHRRRRKFRAILENQAIPPFITVEPRSLLEYGATVYGVDAPAPEALASWLVWRKFLYDIDNRSAQETGYLFEPLIAEAIGGVPYSAGDSPVRRRSNRQKGRQVDCIKDTRAYEFKLRVTIAASGQGRWAEELQFPEDCQHSGFTPILIVLDPTDNPKLAELVRSFESAGGEAYLGESAWEFLRGEAGDRMAKFLEQYVRVPIEQLSDVSDGKAQLLPLKISLTDDGSLPGEEGIQRPVEVYLGNDRVPIR